MKRGGKILCSVAVVSLTACGAQPQLQIRSTPTSPSMVAKTIPIRIAEARVQFALGNVALALESFRKASRDDPSSIEALAGIAACYDRMARFDLSRRYHEMALAIAPGDTQLLNLLAGSLEQQGKREEAAAVRQEIALRTAAVSAAQPIQRVKPTIEVAASVPPEPVAIELPTPNEAASVQPHPVHQKQSKVTAESEQPAVLKPQLGPVPGEPVEIAQAAPLAAPPAPVVKLQKIAEPEIGTSVTVALPPPRPVAAPVVEAQTVPEPAPAPEPEQVALSPEAIIPEPSGPRIERLSMGVVALVTGDGPRWEAKTVAQTERSTTLRFVPLREANARPARVRVLNAARVNRLAARTRSWLTSRGWGHMAIGDAPTTRSRSVVVYPAGQRALAQTLANQFGFEMEERSDARFVTMLLGRDAARIEELQSRRA